MQRPDLIFNTPSDSVEASWDQGQQGKLCLHHPLSTLPSSLNFGSRETGDRDLGDWSQASEQMAGAYGTPDSHKFGKAPAIESNPPHTHETGNGKSLEEVEPDPSGLAVLEQEGVVSWDFN